MVAKLRFFPVGNGDMTLVITEHGFKILVDCHIRQAADDIDDSTPDVAKELRDQLTRDSTGRLFVHAFLLSHPDKDHCCGMKRHFHLGAPADWSKSADKIFINEMWSSPMVFRRASRCHVLCDDALAFNAEARRRVRRFRDTFGVVDSGDRILILGEDENGKTDDLGQILIKVDQQFSRVDGQYDPTMTARLLAPHPKGDEGEEAARSKNHSSVAINFSLAGDGVADACRFLTGGDAEVLIWERMWDRHKMRPDWLRYDILQAPHHCSWHSLSWDSWSEKGEKAKVDAHEGYFEHEAADRMLANLGKIERMNSSEFTAAAKVLKELLAHHIEEEERNIWSDVRENFSNEQRSKMKEEFEAAKKRVRIPH